MKTRSRAIAATVVALVCGGLLPVPSRADEETRQLQEELRRRYQYFGEIDGRPSDELSAAIKSYQKRKGFPVSGLADAATVGSLGLKVAERNTVQGPTLPDGPILRSDEAREISPTDREFLQSLDNALDPPPPHVAAAPEEEAPPATAVPRGVQTPADRAPNAENGSIDRAAVEQFIRGYLSNAEASDPAGELGCYAERVDYFDHGKVGRAFIEKDVRRYYKRWPERKFTLLSLQVRPVSATEATVDFRIRFDLKGKGESARGQTDNQFKVRRGAAGFELIQLKEKRVRT